MIREPRDYRKFPDWIHHELQNWARWCWLGATPVPMSPGHCGSIESQYVRVNDENSSDGARPIPPNEDRARRVDEVWRRLPDAPRLVLRAEYPQRWSSGRVEHGQAGAARRLHMSLRQYEEALAVAIGRVWEAMEDCQ